METSNIIMIISTIVTIIILLLISALMAGAFTPKKLVTSEINVSPINNVITPGETLMAPTDPNNIPIQTLDGSTDTATVPATTTTTTNSTVSLINSLLSPLPVVAPVVAPVIAPVIAPVVDPVVKAPSGWKDYCSSYCSTSNSPEYTKCPEYCSESNCWDCTYKGPYNNTQLAPVTTTTNSTVSSINLLLEPTTTTTTIAPIVREPSGNASMCAGVCPNQINSGVSASTCNNVCSETPCWDCAYKGPYSDPAPVIAPEAASTSLTYKLIKNNATGKCIDGNGTNVYSGDCSAGNGWQNWYYDPSTELIKHKETGKCLDGNGTDTYFGECSTGNTYMKWIYDSYNGFITHKKSGKNLASDANSKIVIQSGRLSENQKWSFQ